MRKFTTFVFVLVLSLGLSTPAKALNPKVLTVAKLAGYGTIGGALLGTASLAFGAKGRAVAVGASLGLYAGLIFGTYVIVTHEIKKKNYHYPVDDGYYPDTSGSPYEGNLMVNNETSFDFDKYNFDGEKDRILVSYEIFSYQF